VSRRRASFPCAWILAGGVSVVAAAQTPPPAQQLPDSEARERNLRAYTELLRSDLRTQKVAVITELMQFTETEDAAFWPIYREYELELTRLNDERLGAFQTYSKVYNQLTATTANELMVKVLDLESRRAALKQKFYGKLKSALSPLTAARVLQIENQIALLIDLQIAAALPVAQ
jgi:hypothetical protein